MALARPSSPYLMWWKYDHLILTEQSVRGQHPTTTTTKKNVKKCYLFCQKAQWVPNLLEPPAHTHIDYVVTNLEGGPKPPAPVEDSYRKNTLTVSRCVLWCCKQPCRTFGNSSLCIYDCNVHSQYNKSLTPALFWRKPGLANPTCLAACFIFR